MRFCMNVNLLIGLYVTQEKFLEECYWRNKKACFTGQNHTKRAMGLYVEIKRVNGDLQIANVHMYET